MNWVPIRTFYNSWTPYQSGSHPAYSKDSNGIVHLRGVFTPGTNGGIAFYLPENFRPISDFAYCTGHAWGYPTAEGLLIHIDYTDGAVRLYWNTSFTASWVSMDGASFSRKPVYL